MSTPPEITKARIRVELAELELQRAEANARSLRNLVDKAKDSYGDALEANGHCRYCEKPRAECPGFHAFRG